MQAACKECNQLEAKLKEMVSKSSDGPKTYADVASGSAGPTFRSTVVGQKEDGPGAKIHVKINSSWPKHRDWLR